MLLTPHGLLWLFLELLTIGCILLFISLQLLQENLSFMRAGPDVCLFMAESQSLEQGLVCGTYLVGICRIKSLQSNSSVQLQHIKQINEGF